MSKKIEPTDAMVEAGASYAWEEANPGILGWNSISEDRKEGCRRDTRAVLAAALNHPDARGLLPFEVVDALRAAREQGWDQAIAWGHDRKPRLINKHGTLADEWRNANPHRPAPDLPAKIGAAIVPADGHEYITATIGGVTYRAREAFLVARDAWLAPWRSDTSMRMYADPPQIDPDTWKVDGQ